VFYSDIKRCWWCPDVAHRPWSDGFPDLTSPFPSPHPVAHRRCKSDEGTDHLLDSSFVSICRVWFIPSSDLVFPVKTVHRRRREGKKNTVYYVCTLFFSILAPALDHIAWGFLFLFFFSLMWHTHTVLARMILIRAPKRPCQPYPGSGQYISKLFFPINFIFFALFISPFFFFGWKHKSSSPTVFPFFFLSFGR
jgi:hypothetical protein